MPLRICSAMKVCCMRRYTDSCFTPIVYHCTEGTPPTLIALVHTDLHMPTVAPISPPLPASFISSPGPTLPMAAQIQVCSYAVTKAPHLLPPQRPSLRPILYPPRIYQPAHLSCISPCSKFILCTFLTTCTQPARRPRRVERRWKPARRRKQQKPQCRDPLLACPTPPHSRRSKHVGRGSRSAECGGASTRAVVPAEHDPEASKTWRAGGVHLVRR